MIEETEREREDKWGGEIERDNERKCPTNISDSVIVLDKGRILEQGEWRHVLSPSSSSNSTRPLKP